MSTPAYRRHDISDHVWSLLAPHLLGQKGQRGRVVRDKLLFVNDFSGFCALVLPGESCHLITGSGKTGTVAFVVARAKGMGPVHLLNVIARSSESMTGNFTRQGIWWKTPSFI